MQGSNNELSGGGRNNIINAEIILHGNNIQWEVWSPGHVSVNPLLGGEHWTTAVRRCAGSCQGGISQRKRHPSPPGIFFFHHNRGGNVSLVFKLPASPLSSIFPTPFYARLESLSVLILLMETPNCMLQPQNLWLH